MIRSNDGLDSLIQMKIYHNRNFRASVLSKQFMAIHLLSMLGFEVMEMSPLAVKTARAVTSGDCGPQAITGNFCEILPLIRYTIR